MIDDSFTLDKLRAAKALLQAARPVMPAIDFSVRTADEQARTIRDVPLMWVRPKVPPKRAGRRGTRRAWKRAHPPHMMYGYREPTDIIVLAGSARAGPFDLFRTGLPDLAIVTPAQMAAINKRLQHDADERAMAERFRW